MKTLPVKYNNLYVGDLSQDESGKMTFQYASKWIVDGFPISLSLPLQKNIFSEKECRPFFEGLLPEGDIRDEIARNLGISSRNDFALLEAMGGDCAGAISVGTSSPYSAQIEAYEEQISDDKLLEALKPLNGKPLFAGEKEVRLSIAGSQRKLPVIYRDGMFFIPHGNLPTTHIIKPEISGIEETVDNEFFCLSLAKKIGLNVPNFEILELAGKKYLIVERYDRQPEAERSSCPPGGDELPPVSLEEPASTVSSLHAVACCSAASSLDNTKRGAKTSMNTQAQRNFAPSLRLVRLHQEDLCQATGIPSENKYQRDGGPGVYELFSIIRQHSSQPALDIKNAIRVIVFNYIIGNADAHGKNFSFLIEKNAIKLAPFYDLLSTEIYPNLSKKMAMKIGGKYEPEDVFGRHWHKFAEEISVNPKFIDKEIAKVSTNIENSIEAYLYSPISNKISRIISKKIEQLRR